MKNLILFALFTSMLFSCSLVEPVDQVDSNNQSVTPGWTKFQDYMYDENNMPLEGVEVSIYADGERYSDKTDKDGFYSISIELDQFPNDGYISMSFYKNGYRPRPVIYTLPLKEKTIYGLSNNSNYLINCPNCIRINTSRSYELWHLGDDNY